MDARSQRLQPAFEAVGHHAEVLVRLREGTAARGPEREVLAAAAATLWRGLADVRDDQALVFKSPEGDVDRADREVAPGACLDLPANGRAVRADTQPEERQNDELLEFTEERSR